MKTKKILKRITALLICGITLFAGVACKGCNDEEESSESGGKLRETYTFEGTHIHNVSDTDIPLVTNGSTDYVLVVPDEMTNILRNAKEDFQLLFNKATGINISVLKSSGAMEQGGHTKESKYLSIGNHELFQSTGLTVSASELGYDGYQVITKDKSVYMVGAYETGSAFSIYSFFEHMFNYAFYYTDCLEIDTNVKNINLKNFDVKEVPDIPMRAGSTCAEMDYTRDVEGGKYLRNRLRRPFNESAYIMRAHKSYSMSSPSAPDHTSFYVLPPETYMADHPNWYSTWNLQLCYTARGDKEEFEWMCQEAAKKVIFSYVNYSKETYPYLSFFNIGFEDIGGHCACEACQALVAEYDANVAPTIPWMNRVGQIFDAWQNSKSSEERRALFSKTTDEEWNGQNQKSFLDVDPTPHIREDFRISFFAYAALNAPPKATKDEATGNYVVDDEMKLYKNIAVYWASTDVDWQKSLLDESNANYCYSYKVWSTLTDTFINWNYGSRYNDLWTFYDNFDSLTSEQFKYYVNCNLKFHKIENASGASQHSRDTAFNALKMYLESMLAWNVNLDTQELIDGWFDAMYADASEAMKKVFYDCRSYASYLGNVHGLYKKHSISEGINDKRYWPKQTVQTWMKSIEAAETHIAKYKESDPELYELVRGRIRTEYVAPAYLYIQFYKNEIPSQELEELLESLREDAVKYDLEKTCNADIFDEYWGDFIGLN